MQKLGIQWPIKGRERERYANNRGEILKRRRKARDQKKAAAAIVNDEYPANATDTPLVVLHAIHDDLLLHTSHIYCTNILT